MKQLSLKCFSIFMMMVSVCVGFTSCGDDDDDDSGSGASGGKGSITVDGMSFNVTNGYYNNINWQDENECLLYFYNCDVASIAKSGNINKYPNPVKTVMVSVRKTGNEAIPTGTFTDFDVTTGYYTKEDMLTNDGLGTQYFGRTYGQTLTISKNGSTYTIRFDAMKYLKVYRGSEDGSTLVDGTSFEFTGNLSDVNFVEYK